MERLNVDGLAPAGWSRDRPVGRDRFRGTGGALRAELDALAMDDVKECPTARAILASPTPADMTSIPPSCWGRDWS